MAKLKAPLMSLGASQQLGKALVFFPWKGLDLVREYVVPANPKTSGQTTQRGYLTAAVTKIHYAQGLAANELASIDTIAYSALGSTYPTPRTWFNTIVKQWLDQRVAGLQAGVWCGAVLTPAGVQIVFKITGVFTAGEPANCSVRWGTSKTALVNAQTVTFAQLQGGIAITGMTSGVKYFLQVRPLTAAGFVGCNSGIYYSTTT